jgi:hypothetical protein
VLRGAFNNTEDYMKTFKDLIFDEQEGKQAVIRFPNNYGVSVINGVGSYGHKEGLYELAVLYEDDLCYTTCITSDVIGHLTPDGASDIMKRVQEL